jgi:hypothetical protein
MNDFRSLLNACLNLRAGFPFWENLAIKFNSSLHFVLPTPSDRGILCASSYSDRPSEKSERLEMALKGSFATHFGFDEPGFLVPG